jgi:hypothetical protein
MDRRRFGMARDCDRLGLRLALVQVEDHV